jgi:hypothetical protein
MTISGFVSPVIISRQITFLNFKVISTLLLVVFLLLSERLTCYIFSINFKAILIWRMCEI